VEEIIQLDKELFLYLNTLGTTTWDGFWHFISGKYNWVPFYILLAFLIYRKLGLNRTLLILVLTFIMIVLTDQVTNVFKNYFLRPRPCFTEDLDGLMRKVDCIGRGRHGFTSAHASNHFGLALFIGLILRKQYKYLFTFLILWAAFISYSRIYLGVHFPLDVICGILLGISVAAVNYKIYKWACARYSVFQLK
jgi:undecaprenyl-diphosphatase